MHAVWWLFFVFPVVGFVGEEARCDDEEPLSAQGFLDLYAPAARDLEARYSLLQMTEERMGLDDGAPVNVWQVRSRSRGAALRVDVSRDDGTQHSVVVRNDIAFSATRNDAKSAFVIVNLHKESNDVDLEAIRLPADLRFAPYCVFDVTVLSFLSQPGCRITSVARSKDEQGQHVTVEWSNPVPEPDASSGDRTGAFVFLPERKWVLDKWTFRFPGGTRSEYGVRTIEYGQDVDGLPVPSRATTERVSEIDGSRRPYVRSVLLDVSSDVPDESEFHTDAFGIAEEGAFAGMQGPQGEVTKPSRRRGVILVGGNVALIAVLIFVVLWRRSRRGESK